MLSDTQNLAIEVSNVSKLYRLGVFGTGSLKDDVKRLYAKLAGKDDPTLMVGAENDRTKSSESNYVWALKDINFSVQKGEVLGIIGNNGAGKSTLLKVLSNIAPPTTGFVKMRGRVASLLEVGTGFHPELTGRENVYLNGAILGMTKKEIASKMDEIVSFSGVAKYIDTPVKRYSSGMKVRLGFAVAAHLEPEILIVDEVLAVGDAEFQKKAIGKMQEVSEGGKRTVLFVSHNMASIKALCSRCVVVDKGRIDFVGDTEEAVNRYLAKNLDSFTLEKEWKDLGDKQIQLLRAKISNENSSYDGFVSREENVEFLFSFKLKEQKHLNLNLQLFTENGEHVLTTGSGIIKLNAGEHVYKCSFGASFLNDIKYYLKLSFIENQKVLISFPEIIGFEVRETEKRERWYGKVKGVVRPKLDWKNVG